jgi:hypothetical protein
MPMTRLLSCWSLGTNPPAFIYFPALHLVIDIVMKLFSALAIAIGIFHAPTSAVCPDYTAYSQVSDLLPIDKKYVRTYDGPRLLMALPPKDD